MSTDRPDRTESPYTVPPGWFQIESDLATAGRIAGDDERLTETALLTINAKYGVTHRIDLQFVFNPWERVEATQEGFPDQSDSGTGSAGLRAKFNLFGNDDGGIAFALLPFATVPTRGDAILDFITWGMVAPLAIPIGDAAALTFMGGITSIDDEDWWGSVSGSFGTAIAGDFAGFVEFYLSRSSFDSDAIDDTTFDIGVTFAPGDNWQLDAGVYRGLATETEDWRVFLGASVRTPL
ncbi:MAG TPA: transporter [Candidatus Krumholzibacteria bacterium]|nr:transporter [Candidatus Krumholzibacteria bacterium]